MSLIFIAITGSNGGDWVEPAYDKSGNMIEIPQPNAPGSGYDATYDAWGRLVKLEDSADTVAEYVYDAQGRRIIKHIYDSGTFDYSDHSYYSGWQCIEVRRDTDATKGGDPDADAMEIFVYHPYYIDAVAVRYWDDPDDGGGLNGTWARQYYIHDAQFNVIALMDNAGAIIERYRYTPYGEQTVMDASYDDDYDSDTDPTDNVSLYAQHKGFTGQTLDHESGLWYFRSRYYHDGLGAFIARDPIGYPNGMNAYAGYFGIHGLIDPSGLIQASITIEGNRDDSGTGNFEWERVRQRNSIEWPGPTSGAKDLPFGSLVSWEFPRQYSMTVEMSAPAANTTAQGKIEFTGITSITASVSGTGSRENDSLLETALDAVPTARWKKEDAGAANIIFDSRSESNLEEGYCVECQYYKKRIEFTSIDEDHEAVRNV